jgi:hypothetical protein
MIDHAEVDIAEASRDLTESSLTICQQEVLERKDHLDNII